MCTDYLINYTHPLYTYMCNHAYCHNMLFVLCTLSYHTHASYTRITILYYIIRYTTLRSTMTPARVARQVAGTWPLCRWPHIPEAHRLEYYTYMIISACICSIHVIVFSVWLTVNLQMYVWFVPMRILAYYQYNYTLTLRICVCIYALTLTLYFRSTAHPRCWWTHTLHTISITKCPNRRERLIYMRLVYLLGKVC